MPTQVNRPVMQLYALLDELAAYGRWLAKQKRTAITDESLGRDTMIADSATDSKEPAADRIAHESQRAI